MASIAVDLVLLPPFALTDAAVRLNRVLFGVEPQPILLNASDCLPHVSLAMGCLETARIPETAAMIGRIATGGPIDLIPIEFHERAGQTGHNVSSLVIKRTRRLQALHEHAMRELTTLFHHGATSDMFLSEGTVTPSTIRWVDQYGSTAAFDNFWPHITLGMGRVPHHATLPAEAIATRLALCQLGPHCTCRRILVERLITTD